jgi:CPA2 family monovalent cation:H+ antiporter-2
VSRDWLFPNGPQVLFWCAISFLVLVPLIAVWRNLAVLSMLFTEVVFSSHPKQGVRFAPVLEFALKVFSGLVVFLWVSSFLPLSGSARWVPFVVISVVALVIVLFRRKLIYWHSVLEVGLQEHLTQTVTGGSAPAWLKPHAEWNLTLEECMVPDLADVRGRTLAQLELRKKLGCTVAGVERQGVMLESPPASFAIYPRDRVLLLGTPDQTAAGKELIMGVSGAIPPSGFDEVRMEAVILARESSIVDCSLRELGLSQKVGVQVAGINRQGLRFLNPGAKEVLLAGDEVLVLGTNEQIAAFTDLASAPDASA